MITKPNNDYNVKYSALFADAFKLLKENNKLTEAEIAAGAFTSLEEYFTHIKDLADLHVNNVQATKNQPKNIWNSRFALYSKYLMLPLDEEPFRINTNTRVISIPSIIASHGIGLHGDQRAETLLFEMDRYFDFIDLITTNIYAQWINPAGQEDATLLTMVDYDQTKIRLGWTLSKKALGGNGTFTFSIRLVARDADDKIVYSLNTLPVSVKVKPALNTEGEIEPTDEESWAFIEAVSNGANSGVKDYPQMATIYKDLSTASINLVDDITTLDIGAFAPDTGLLTYSWIYTPYLEEAASETYVGTNTYYYIPTKDAEKVEGHTYYTFNSENNTYEEVTGDLVADVTYYERDKQVLVDYVQTADDSIRDEKGELIGPVPHKKYYIYDEENGVYSLVDIDAFDPDVTYYEENAKLVILNSSNDCVAGQYRADITNTISGITTTVSSKTTTIPATTKIIYKTDLKESGIQNVMTGEGTPVAVLRVVAEPDEETANLSYQWYNKTTADGSLTPIENASASTYEAVEAGWYQVRTTSSLNRTSTYEDSTTAKVTNAAIAPTISSNTNNVQTIVINNAEQVANITITASATSEGIADALVSDGLTYDWKCQLANTEPAQYVSAVVGEHGVVSINQNVLTVKYAGDQEIFKCIVTNTLNGTTASSESDRYVVMN